MPLVLVVDDDPDFRRAIHHRLERATFDVEEAASSREAFELFDDHTPDVVVSDVLMPGGNGFDFYEGLVQRCPEIRRRFIFLTAAADDPVINRRVEEYGAPLLGKLEDLGVVVDAVRLALVRAATD